jgi:asparagine synthase (glutamine-hydrolysing)
MPGFFGVIQKTSEQDTKQVCNQLLAAMRQHNRLSSEACVARSGRWALGRVHLGILQANSQLAADGDVQVLFHGDLHNIDDLRMQVEEKYGSQPSKEITLLVSALYQTYGNQFVTRLKGAFCVVVLDERKKQLVLANDLFGSYFLYWINGARRLIFASELRAVLQALEVKPTLNPRAVADYLTFGFLFGEKTLAAQVQLLPPASILTYSWDDNICTLKQYAHIQDAFQPWEGTQAEYYEEIRYAFNHAVRRVLVGKQRFGLSLSGGLDSRAILSVIACDRIPISTYTLGVKGCADEVIAEQLSRIAGTKHKFIEIDTDYLNKGIVNLQRIVSLTDGMYLTHGLTEILALQFLEQADFSILLRGHGGELAKASLAWPLHTDERIYKIQSREEFASYLLKRVNYISHSVTLHELLTKEWFVQVEGQASRSLEESIDGVQLSPPDLCSYLYLTEHHRRFTIASLELFRGLVEVRMPFVDQDFLRVLFRGPTRWRDGTDIHRAIVKANNLTLLKVRNSNTGAPGNALPVVEKLLNKLNSLFKRLNIYGYRHYHNFERWMKQTLLDSVEKVLLQPECLRRGIYREQTLRQLIEETKHSVADHAYLLQILLILELWQQENS